MGPGKIRLLELVGESGSISEAARRMNNMSYRHAWLLIRSLNTMFNLPVLTTKIGGKGGGGTAVTPFGESLIARFRAFERRITAQMEEEFVDLDASFSTAHIPERESALSNTSELVDEVSYCDS